MKYYLDIPEVQTMLPRIHPSHKGSVFRPAVDTDPFTGKAVHIVEGQERRAKGGVRWTPVGTNGRMWMFETPEIAEQACSKLNGWAITVII